MQFRGVYKIFWRSKGGFARTPLNPPCLRACIGGYPQGDRHSRRWTKAITPKSKAAVCFQDCLRVCCKLVCMYCMYGMSLCLICNTSRELSYLPDNINKGKTRAVRSKYERGSIRYQRGEAMPIVNDEYMHTHKFIIYKTSCTGLQEACLM